MILYIIGALVVVLGIVAVVIVKMLKRDEIKEYYKAARNIFREDRLNEMLKRGANGNSRSNMTVRPMIYLKLKADKTVKCVFDPSRPVMIGRDSVSNQLCIDEAIVSHNHCQIFSFGNEIWLQDLGSANGSVIQRGSKRYSVGSGQCVQIFDKDRLTIGTTEIKVTVFMFDPVYM